MAFLDDERAQLLAGCSQGQEHLSLLSYDDLQGGGGGRGGSRARQEAGKAAKHTSEGLQVAEGKPEEAGEGRERSCKKCLLGEPKQQEQQVTNRSLQVEVSSKSDTAAEALFKVESFCLDRQFRYRVRLLLGKGACGHIGMDETEH